MVHLGIIPDGNRRWCKKNDYKLNDLTKYWTRIILSHIKNLIDETHNQQDFKKKVDKYKYLKQVDELSFYVCSIDNVRRTDGTPEQIFNLIRQIYDIYNDPDKYLQPDPDLLKFIHENKDKYIKKYKDKINLHVNIIGDIELLPKDIQDMITELQTELKPYQNPNYKKFTINVAVAYDYNKDMVNFGSNHIENYNRIQSDIDIIFRSGGEKRISGFFPTKILYSELFFVKPLWPSISLLDLNKIVKKFFHRNRRFGK